MTGDGDLEGSIRAVGALGIVGGTFGRFTGVNLGDSVGDFGGSGGGTEISFC